MAVVSRGSFHATPWLLRQLRQFFSSLLARQVKQFGG